jgi:hypothetical protein
MRGGSEGSAGVFGERIMALCKKHRKVEAKMRKKNLNKLLFSREV